MAITKGPRHHSLFFFISFLGINSSGFFFLTLTKNPHFKKSQIWILIYFKVPYVVLTLVVRFFLYLGLVFFFLCTITLAASKVLENSDLTIESLTLRICNLRFSTIRIMDLIFACDISVSFLHPHNISFLDTHKLPIAALVKIISLCFWASLY